MKFVRPLISVACGMAAAAVLAVAVQAQPAQSTVYPSFQQGAPKVQSAAAVAVFWEAGSIVRSKNVISVGNPSTGVYCVHASVHLDKGAIVPIATPEFSGSTVSTMFVYVVDNKADCVNQDNTVDIRTYTLSGSTAVLSNDVSFYMSII